MSDTPRTDAAARLVRTTENGVLVHANFARELERENAALREQVEELDAKWKMAEDQCFDQVGKIGELKRENAALRKAKDMVELERCEMMRSMSLAQNYFEQLRADKERLDFLATLTGSGWACLHLNLKETNDDWLLTRKQIDRRMATEPKL